MDHQEIEEKVNFIVFYAEQRDITEDEVELINKRIERLRELIGYHEKEIVRISRALAEPQLEESVLPISGVSFSEDCECNNDEVCGLCFRKKGYEMIDNKLTLTGETEVCDKCEETFTYAGDYRNICFKCEHDYV